MDASVRRTCVRSRSTGKERDAETGLDYFGARYFSGAQGRWTSPDQINITSEGLASPSSTLNKYVYGGNNPLKFIDPDGKDITVFYEQGVPTGHIMMSAFNQQSGDFAFMSVGPQTHLDPNIPLHPFDGVPGTPAFSLPTSVDDLKSHFASITIQTTPEVAQQAIDAIRNGAGAGNWALLGNNCTSACAKVLKEIGVLGRNSYLTPFPRPNTLWNTLRAKYQPNLSSSERLNLFRNSGSLFKVNNGTDYGSPRYGLNTFDWLMLQLKAPLKECISVSDSASGHNSKDCK
ncbi:MAG TPA: RHS repeat-associated core domain-containing protein [Bryobacteraceae bacterium]|nr:RHS repeat-associated core domain-containing protein [Bryobacteraceae bacterium]